MNTFDVIVIGGGAAGLSGALTLARARRSVLVLDAGDPRNAPASGVHGFLTRDGMPPAELVATGAAEVARYGGTVVAARATSARRAGTGFAVGTADGREFTARRLLVTTGLVDELPDVPGLRERWGRDVLHCPYCHGWEVRDEPIGVLGGGPLTMHQTLLLRQWSPHITLFRHTGPEPTEEEWEQLAARDIAVVDGEVTGLEIVDDRLSGVRLVSGRVHPVRALAVGPRFLARSEVLAGLGLAAVEHPAGVGTHIVGDARGLTAVPGVWVAGNVADPAAQVIGAAGGGR
ncbi:NAD(P)/FAD-dependent oxidoreductase, partial [Pseudonocardia nigra]|uniref:NAD(P)/FAD-dependent oxidoreductase n=1 Tax=Pseudonocardia nigra TaxID=1921578 RepID=UPI001C5CE3B7